MKTQQWSVGWSSGVSMTYTRFVVDGHPDPTEAEMRPAAADHRDGVVVRCHAIPCDLPAPTETWDPQKQAMVPFEDMFVVRDGVYVPRGQVQ